MELVRRIRIYKQPGFTLMELIIAMAILAILATGGLATYTRSLKRGRDAQRKSDLAQIQKALELYFNDNESYPADDGSGRINACSGSCSWGTDAFEDTTTGTIYMKVLPKDPRSTQYYFYRRGASGISYQLYAMLENEDDPQAGNVTSPPNCSTDACNYGVASSNEKP